jgi:hypothetical protein
MVTPIWYVCEGGSVEMYVNKPRAKQALNVCNTGQYNGGLDGTNSRNGETHLWT